MWSPKIVRIVIAIFFLTFLFVSIGSANIIGPEVTISDKGDVIVKTNFHNTEDFETSIRTGITKDITISVQVRKIKKFWPDKLVKKKDIAIIIKHNNLKETFTVTTSTDSESNTNVFKNYLRMVKSTFIINDLHIVNTHNLPEGKYFVMIVMESHRVRLPPIIRHLLFFVPEKEFIIIRKSIPFVIRH